MNIFIMHGHVMDVDINMIHWVVFIMVNYLELNFKTAKLIFCKNGVSQGVFASNLKKSNDIRYKLAVCLAFDGDSIG